MACRGISMLLEDSDEEGATSPNLVTPPSCPPALSKKTIKTIKAYIAEKTGVPPSLSTENTTPTKSKKSTRGRKRKVVEAASTIGGPASSSESCATDPTTTETSTAKKRGRKPKNERLRLQQQMIANGITLPLSPVSTPRKKKTIYTPSSVYTSPEGLTPEGLQEKIMENDALPSVRFPTVSSVPEHLLAELSILFPRRELIIEKEKKVLEAEQPISSNVHILLGRMYAEGSWDCKLLNRLAKLLLGRTGTTLSHLEWLCSHMCRDEEVKYRLPPSSSGTTSEGTLGREIDLFQEHRRQLSIYFHGYLDFFARDQRLMLEYEETTGDPFWNSFGECTDPLGPKAADFYWDRKKLLGMRYLPSKTDPRGYKRMIYLVTSFGQLNVLRWAYPLGVVDWAEQNHLLIDAHRDRKDRETVSKGTGKRRRLCEKRVIMPTKFCTDEEQSAVLKAQEQMEGIQWID